MTKRWFTCTPIHLKGDAAFFARDSGLCCRSLQELGFDSRAVMPVPAMPDDEPDLIRTKHANLESADWWRQWELEGVILYSWGAPRYLKVAQAIKKVGAKLVINMDSDGILTPYVNGIESVRKMYRFHSSNRPLWQAFPLASVQLIRHLWPWCVDYRRVKHMACADVIVAVSPIAMELHKQYLEFFGRSDVAPRVKLGLHPIPMYMTYDGRPKAKDIIAVGTWECPRKNPRLLVATVARTLTTQMDYTCNIFGTGEEAILRELDKLTAEIRARIHWGGRIANKELAEHYQKSRICLCTSHDESFHLGAAEALCCGCSVVGPSKATFPTMPYFVSEQSGRLAGSYDTEGMAEAMDGEIQSWNGGGRDPERISRIWRERLHVNRVVERMIKWAEEAAAQRMIS